MTPKDRNDLNLEHAIRSLRDERVEPTQLSTSGARVWERLHIPLRGAEAPQVEKIRGCDDVLALLGAYRQGSLPTARALLIEEHLRDCLGCRSKALGSGAQDVAGWKRPAHAAAPGRQWSWAQMAAAAVVLAVVGISGFLVHYEFFAVPPGSRAVVQSVEGQLYRVSAGSERLLAAGDELQEGERIRAAESGHAFVRLTDGSVVEMDQRSEFSVSARRRSTTIRLERGNIIVEAAKRRSGNLYVASRDVRVAVTGTVFSVSGGTRGSRVAVIEGMVKVAYNGMETTLAAGEQVASNDSLEPVEVAQEIAWSRKLEDHLALLAEFAALQKKLATVQMPGLRYASRLLPLVPGDAIVYAAVPNLGEAIHQAHELFQQQLTQSPQLRAWWQQAQGAREGLSPEQVIAKVRTLSQFVGDEIVVALVPDAASGDKDVVILAEAARSGLREFLESEAQTVSSETGEKLRFYDARSVASAAAPRGVVSVLVRPDVVALSSNVARLRQISAQLDAGTGSGFAGGAFGQRLQAAYSGGAGLLLGVDMEGIRGAHAVSANVERSGVSDLRYVVVERKEAGGRSENAAAFEFSRARRGLPSWLGAPGPMGSLDFVSPGASMVASVVAKSPALMLDDLLAASDSDRARTGLAELEAKLALRLRDDIAGSLGNDFTFALDGPVLPTPSWKLVAEVNDPQRLQFSLQQIVEHINQEAQREGKTGVSLRQEQVDGRVYYVLVRQGATVSEIHYTFAEGYAIVAPSRALVRRALQIRLSGDSLARAGEFRALLPPDHQANVSGLMYQNLAATLAPLMAQVSPERAAALQQLTASSEPSMVCAYGEPERIRLTSKSGTLGADLNKLAVLGWVQAIMGGTREALQAYPTM